MNLSPREKMLIRCIALNWDTSKCAEEMGVSKNTIGSMKFNIRQKLGKQAEGPLGLYLWAQKNKEELGV